MQLENVFDDIGKYGVELKYLEYDNNACVAKIINRLTEIVNEKNDTGYVIGILRADRICNGAYKYNPLGGCQRISVEVVNADNHETRFFTVYFIPYEDKQDNRGIKFTKAILKD